MLLRCLLLVMPRLKLLGLELKYTQLKNDVKSTSNIEHEDLLPTFRHHLVILAAVLLFDIIIQRPS